MTQADMEHYRDRLESLAQRLKSTFANLSEGALRQSGGEASGSLSNAPLHMADLGTDVFE